MSRRSRPNEENSNKQTLNNSGGPEKDHWVIGEPCIHPIWMSTDVTSQSCLTPIREDPLGQPRTRLLHSTNADLSGCHQGRD